MQTPEKLAIEQAQIITAIYAIPYPKYNVAKADKSCYGHRYRDMQGCGTCNLINKCMNTGDVEVILKKKGQEE